MAKRNIRSVSLTSQADTAVAELQARTGHSFVDLVNHSLQMWNFLNAEMAEGSQIIVRSTDDTGNHHDKQLMVFFG